MQDDFLLQLEEEIQQTKDDIQRQEQEERLKKALSIYKGKDEIVGSDQLGEVDESATLIPTGFSDIDAIIGGFVPEQLVVLSAQEKSGKTTFALQLIESMKNPCCFLFEQSPNEIVRQMKQRGQTIPYFVTPKNHIDNTYEWLEKRSIEAMVKFGSNVFVIDNVDWVEKNYKHNQRTDEALKDLLLKLKQFCTRWHVVIVLIAHVKKIPMEQMPQPDDIKDTAAFKQIADLVLMLWRKTKKERVTGTRTQVLNRTNETLLWVAENRRTGKLGYVQLVFDGKRFSQKTWDVELAASEEFESSFSSYE